ncbi:Fe-S cluster assembly protein SufD [Novilysobacter antarcticus]|uniref:Fe-S cluster assembly protein SufD n=1 Tax=Novilysobacter antarcticus TaxID=2862543 RepID=UPI001C99176D|nr:Fe-S cluster assembly protein SufD [Lysobacter antarcticus]
MSALLDSLTAGFDTLPSRDAAGLGGVRRAALDAAMRDGLPHARVEAWKYTPLRALERRTFETAGLAPRIDSALLEAIPSPRIVFVNGRYDEAWSDIARLPEGVTLQPLSNVLDEGETDAASFMQRSYDRSDEVFARLNAALATQGVVLRVEADQRPADTIHLVFVGTGDTSDRAWHLRHLIELGDGAHLKVVEHQLMASEHRHFANTIMQVQLGKGARLSHARLQDESTGATLIHRTDAVVGEDAEYRRIDLELGAGLSRHELNVVLLGNRSRVHANGVLLADGKRHLDTRLGIDHAGRDSACELVWRGIGSGRSRAVFHGGIQIRQGADGSDAMLSNKNLLLSEGAEIDTQPVLVIHADEVQAAHGATVGQLDPTAMFYLRSRGLPADQARMILTAAFCRETLSVLDDTGMHDAALARLDGALERSIPA